jgi:acyl carrier protein
MADTLTDVRNVLIATLTHGRSPAHLAHEAPLFGALRQLDSFRVVARVGALEKGSDVTADDDEFGAEPFGTAGSLTEFVDATLAAQR